MKIFPVYSYNSKKDIISFQAKLPKISQKQQFELRDFFTYIYEYKKGVKPLALITTRPANREFVEAKLQHAEIPYHISAVGKAVNSVDNKNESKLLNIFFGNEKCIEVVKTFTNSLSQLSDEKDFMLGQMLGYDVVQQCQRYLKRIGKKLGSA